VKVLQNAGIPYMLTGSIASSAQGEPRSTHDVDIVVSITLQSAEALLKEFQSPDFYLDRQAIAAALQNKSMFNMLEIATGNTVDFWVLTDSPYDQSRFGRRQQQNIDDLPVTISAPEDTILQKLRWAKDMGGSEKQINDVRRVYRLQGPILNLDYIREWAEKLDVQDLWSRLKQEG
jgi:hypothetical protein